MTTLDEKALEAAAKALATHWRTNGVEQDWPGYRDEALAVIRAYLEALPPAEIDEDAYASVMSRVVGNGTLRHHARSFLKGYLAELNARRS